MSHRLTPERRDNLRSRCNFTPTEEQLERLDEIVGDGALTGRRFGPDDLVVADSWSRIAKTALAVGVSPYFTEGSPEHLRVAADVQDALVELIRKAEWAGDCQGSRACPWCENERYYSSYANKSDHTKDCPAARVLYPEERS